jgi:hypothetical protein
MIDPKTRSSTTDKHRFTRMIKGFVGLPGLTHWMNNLKFIFIRVHRCPSVVRNNFQKIVGFGVGRQSKRQRAGALQDAGAFKEALEIRGAPWSAAALHRLSLALESAISLAR